MHPNATMQFGAGYTESHTGKVLCGGNYKFPIIQSDVYAGFN